MQFLLVGGGTAAFAAMRAIRAARPGAQVLLVGEERALPYMRPPLSKELWREPDLAARAADPDRLTFRQWNGKRRSVVYEPSAFYAPVEGLASAEHGGAAVARGWRVARLDVARHEAELRAPGREPVTLRYDKCLVATGERARPAPPPADAGRAADPPVPAQARRRGASQSCSRPPRRGCRSRCAGCATRHASPPRSTTRPCGASPSSAAASSRAS